MALYPKKWPVGFHRVLFTMLEDATTYYNPLNGEHTKILKSSADTLGEYTLLEVSLMPGGGNPPHYHTRFTEEFIAIEAVLASCTIRTLYILNPERAALYP